MKPTKMRNMQIYRASAGTKNKQLVCNVSKNLRLKHGKRSTRVLEGDSILVVRGEYKGVTGKVHSVSMEYGTVAIDGLKKEKAKGEKIDVYIRASNIIITGLDNEDRRLSKQSITTTPAVTEQPESEDMIESESNISQESESVLDQDSSNDDLLDYDTKQDMKNMSDADGVKDATTDTSDDTMYDPTNNDMQKIVQERLAKSHTARNDFVKKQTDDDMTSDDTASNDVASNDMANNDKASDDVTSNDMTSNDTENTSENTTESTAENSKDSKEEKKEDDV
ncbi:MAG: 50S ribosomal protein L24 [Thaumarchaeota archaeon]|nr:50S ribosomal protein L24 [Nitrososphaerota archaeon]